MATLPASCVLCGIPINPRLGVWMGHFRALYLRSGLEPNQDEVHLSGVGNRDEHNGIDQAPLDRDVRYYQNNFQPESLRNFGLLSEDYGRPLQIPTQRGIPFHFACWEILQRVAGGDEAIDLKTLRSFFLDFPLQNGKVNWGHDYGLLPYQGSAHDFRAHENIFHAGFDEGRERSLRASWDKDPTESLLVLATIRIAHPSKHVRPLPMKDGSDEMTDRFRQLPQEIRDIILFQLSSREVLSLKLSSRSFAESNLGDAFWASRFASDKEMGHVYEVHTTTQRKSCWRDIYFEFLGKRTTQLALQNRRRIWSLASTLLQTIEAIKTGSKLEGIECGAPRTNSMFDVWTVESNTLSCDPDFADIFSRGARMRPGLTRYVRGVERSCRIKVSFIELPAGRFISGLTMQNIVVQKMQRIGYIHPENEVVLSLHQSEDGELMALDGFELAVGTQGFLGIRCLGKNNETGPWVGEYEGVPKKLLPFKGLGPILLTCNFDSTKLLTMYSSNLANTTSCTFSQKLRENSKWHPGIPAAHHHLSPLVPNNKSPGNNFLPNETLYFGGEHGERLAHVTGMRFWVDGGDLAGMGFTFDDDEFDNVNTIGESVVTADNNQIPFLPKVQRRHILGRAQQGLLTPENTAIRRPSSGFYDYDYHRSHSQHQADKMEVERLDFVIDGKAGETIIKIEVGVSARNGRMVAPKISTNFERVFMPRDWVEAVGNSTIEVLAKDEVLVGIYARRNHSGAFTSMGGITTTAQETRDDNATSSAVQQSSITASTVTDTAGRSEIYINENIEHSARNEEGSSDTDLEKLLGGLCF